MELKFKKKKEDTIVTRYSVPVSFKMKEKLEQLASKNLDINAMTRDFFNGLISKAEKQESGL